jgi:diaminohydroxyphosphoribosylaminopyrimidine deaminase / 5-amino-6-(5-phosphoribosylamino)uracil reductase
MNANTDISYMTLALKLAEKGRGTVSPNPMVGAVIVRHDVIVGRGWHQRAGGDHAEVMALRQAGDEARGATLYVTLEPCCHHGKTPPCTVSVAGAGIARVVAAIEDPNPLVCGTGCRELSDAGITVETGVLENEARRLNEAFFVFVATRRPFVTLKLATTLDGRVADASGGSRWITGPETRRMVHRWRSWSDAVTVGAGTVLADDPALTVRDVPGSDPIRVIVDSRLRVPPEARVYGEGRSIAVTTEAADTASIAALEARGVEVVRCGMTDDHVSLDDLMAKLGERDITSVLCEGGPTIAAALLRDGLVNKVAATVAPAYLGQGPAAVANIGAAGISDALRLEDVTIESSGGDTIITGYPPGRTH